MGVLGQSHPPPNRMNRNRFPVGGMRVRPVRPRVQNVWLADKLLVWVAAMLGLAKVALVVQLVVMVHN